jgi:hypothetical protein
MSKKAGMKKWGETAKEAMREELHMLLDEEVFEAIPHPTPSQKANALRIHGFVG